MKVEITDDEFDEALFLVISDDIGCTLNAAIRLLQIPGIYEILSEYYSNRVSQQLRD